MVHFVADAWSRARLPFKALAVVYAAPAAIWGVCATESAVRCVLRALHTLVSLNAEGRNYRWRKTEIHAFDFKGTGALTLASLVPILGTFKAYEAILVMTLNHVSNTWRLRNLQQQVSANDVEKLYRTLVTSWEPDLDRLLAYTKDRQPTPEELQDVALNLEASLVGRCWTYSIVFHSIDGGCRGLNILAIRIQRAIAAIFSGYLTRLIARTLTAFQNHLLLIKRAVQQEIQYVRNLVDQPEPIELPMVPFDIVYHLLEACKTPEQRERLRLQLAKRDKTREYATCNVLTQVPGDRPLPSDAPDIYYHALRELPKAFSYYSRMKTEGKKAQWSGVLPYFNSILYCLDHFRNEWTDSMTPEAKKDLLWSLATQMPNMREMILDLGGIDSRWQMIIVFQLARHCRSLQSVTFRNAHPRAAEIMRRFCNRGCVVVH